ncbi:FecR family protein [soil metagenome]
MNQYQFDKLLEKYLEGECTPREEKFIVEWQENLTKTSSLSLPGTEKRVIKKRVWKRLQQNSLKQGRIIFWDNTWVKLGIAASLLVALGSLSLFRSGSESDDALPIAATAGQEAVAGDIEVKNTSAHDQEVRLMDGSLVILKKNSSIHYAKDFGLKTRTVSLTGEAYFEVKKDPGKLFIVYAGELVTEVLGTSFIIKSYGEDKATEVSVLTGKVSVYENQAEPVKVRSGIILTPNQKTTYNKEDKKLIPGIVEQPAMLHSPASSHALAFEEAPLPAVLKTLESTYGLELWMENQKLNNCVFTGDLNGLPFPTQLELICKAINATSEQRGTAIFIKGKGCESETLEANQN